MNLIATVFCTTLLSFLHPFFMSMTDINYNRQDKELEISVRIFTDDFENTLRKYHNDKIDILHPENKAQMDGFVKDYIQKKLSFTIDGKPATMSFVGYEQQEESIWSYFEIKNITSVQKLGIYNALLQDYNNSQVNIVHIKVNDTDESRKLDYPENKLEFAF